MKSLFGLGKKKEKTTEDFTIVNTSLQSNSLQPMDVPYSSRRQTVSPQQSSLSLHTPPEQLKRSTSLYSNNNDNSQMTAAVMVDSLISDIMTELNRKPAAPAADELRADMSLAMRLSAQMEGSFGEFRLESSTQQSPSNAHLATPDALPMPRTSRSANAAIPPNISNKVPSSLTRSSSRAAHLAPISIPEHSENSLLAPSIQPRPRSTSTTSSNIVINTSTPTPSNGSLGPPLPTLRRSKSTGLQDGSNTGIIAAALLPKNEPLLLSRKDSLSAKSHSRSSRKPDPSPSRLTISRKPSTLEAPEQEEVRLGRSRSVARPEKDLIPNNTDKTKTSLPRRSSLANLKPVRESVAPMPQPQIQTQIRTQSIQISSPIQTPPIPSRKSSIAVRKPRETLAPEPPIPSPSSPSSLRPSPTPSPSPSPKLTPSRRSSLANFKQHQESFVPENAPPLPPPVPLAAGQLSPADKHLSLWSNEPVYANLSPQKNIKSQVDVANEAAAALAAIVGEVDEISVNKPSPVLMAKKIPEEKGIDSRTLTAQQQPLSKDPVIGSDSIPTPDLTNIIVEPTKVEPNFAAVLSPTQDSPTLGVLSPVFESLTTVAVTPNIPDVKEKKTEEKEKKQEEYAKEERKPIRQVFNQELKKPIIEHKIESEVILHGPEQKQLNENILVKEGIIVENFFDKEKSTNEVVATEGVTIEKEIGQELSVDNSGNTMTDEKAVDRNSSVERKLTNEEPAVNENIDGQDTVAESETFTEGAFIEEKDTPAEDNPLDQEVIESLPSQTVSQQNKTEKLGEEGAVLQGAAADIEKQTAVENSVDDSAASIFSISTISLASETVAHSTPRNSIRASTAISVKTSFDAFEHDSDDDGEDDVMSPWRTLAIHEISPTLTPYDFIKPRSSSDSMIQVSTQVDIPERKSQESQTQTDPVEELDHKDEEENIPNETAEEVGDADEGVSPADDADADTDRPSARSTIKVPLNLQRSSSLGAFRPSQRQRSPSPLNPATPSGELFKNESNTSEEDSPDKNRQMPKMKHRQSDGSMVSESLKKALEEQRQSQVIIQAQQRQIHDLQLQLSLSQQALRTHPTSPSHVYNGLVLSVPPILSGSYNPPSSPSNITRSSSRSSSVSPRNSKGSSGRNSSLERAFRSSRGYN